MRRLYERAMMVERKKIGLWLLLLVSMLVAALLCSAAFSSEAHAATKGWKLVHGGKDLVYVEKGKKVKSTVIDGITLNKKGYAVKDYAGKLKIMIMKRVKQLTKPGMTKREKLRKCFNWCLWHGWENNEPTDYGTEGWVQRHAYQYISERRGECIGFACSVAMFAYELGYKPTVRALPRVHAWVLINGKAFDNMHGGIFFGTPQKISGTKAWKITSWSSHSPKGVTVPVQKSKQTSGLFTYKKNYYYSKGGKLLRHSFANANGHRYYFGFNGQAYKGCKKIKGKYYVFNSKGRLCKGTKTRTVRVKGISYLVSKNGRCVAGWNKAHTKYFLANGKKAKGVCYVGGKLVVFNQEGAYDSNKTAAVQAVFKIGGPAEQLLAVLGDPFDKRTIGSSCYSVPGYPELIGKDLVYRYDHAILNIFASNDGRLFLESIDIR